jgi:MFS family permease
MAADLGFSEAVYGFGAGIFFVGYFLLEIPGALIVERWSARLWMSRILITWGICTALVGFARTPGQFYAARFCLGLAEAGFFPGVLVYLTTGFRRATAQAPYPVSSWQFPSRSLLALHFLPCVFRFIGLVWQAGNGCSFCKVYPLSCLGS